MNKVKFPHPQKFLPKLESSRC